MDKRTLDWYNKNAKTYYQKDTIYPEDTKHLLRFISSVPKNGKVLDAGCGGGNFSTPMRDAGLSTFGIDLAEELIKICKDANPDIDFRVADIRKLPFENNFFDGIWAHASLVHMEKEKDTKKSLEEFGRVLKKGGRLHLNVKKRTNALTEYVIESKTEEERFFRYYSEDEVREFLENSGFEIELIESYNELERNGMGREDTYWINIFAIKK